jgi:hypothetical protein
MGKVSVKFVDKVTTYFMPNSFLSIIMRLCDSVEKHGTARQSWDDNMLHAHCVMGD